MAKTKYNQPTQRRVPIIAKYRRTKRIIPSPDLYYFHVPDNYINAGFVEDAEIKNRLIYERGTGITGIKNITSAQLAGICKEFASLTQNLIMQMNNSIVLYVENKGQIKSAATIGLGFDVDDIDFENFDFDNEDEDEEDKPWNINSIKILTLCSKESGYGKKLMDMIKLIVMLGQDNGYITSNVKIILNSTESSQPFYLKQGFVCVGNECTFTYSGGFSKKRNKTAYKKNKNAYKKPKLYISS